MDFQHEDPKVIEAARKIASVIEGQPREKQIRIIRTAMEREEREQAIKRAKLAAVQRLIDWNPPLVLERNDCSRLHKLKAALLSDGVVGPAVQIDANAARAFIEAIQSPFVIKHDWAGAFSNAEGIDDSWRLPYDWTAFEFRFGGHTVILNCWDIDGPTATSIDVEPRGFTAFVETDDYWYAWPPDAKDDWMRFAWDQVRAVCIALDAEVATSTIVRQPTKLNEKRTRSGKVPLSDYRVVDLARRHRIANPADVASTGARKRLHFRRGHWRHYDSSKTWIKWCLVGDPDLGFIQKHYAL